MRLNNDSAGNYQYRRLVFQNGVANYGATSGAGYFGGNSGEEAVVPAMITVSTSYVSLGSGWFIVYDYTSTSKIFSIEASASGRFSTNTVKNWHDGYYSNSGTAITQIDFIRSDTQTVNGRFYLYGVS